MTQPSAAPESVTIRVNRRQHRRTKFEGPVLVDTRDSQCTARAQDVSAGGIRLESERPMPIGKEVDVYFEIGSLAVETSARVVRSEGTIHCLEFNRKSRHSTPARRLSFLPRPTPLVA